jgi:hypothetical protein
MNTCIFHVDWKTKKVKGYSFIQYFPIYETALLCGRFQVFTRLSFWSEQRVDEDQYAALVEWYWQGKAEALGEKAVPLPQISPAMSWDRTRTAAVRGPRLTAWAMARPKDENQSKPHLKIKLAPLSKHDRSWL